MFEQILQEVKEKFGDLTSEGQNLPSEHADAIHQEIANHIHNSTQASPATETSSSSGGILSELESSLTSGNLLTSAVTGGLVGSLGRKFGLSSAVTGAIAASLPGLIEKYMQKKTAENPSAAPVATA